MQHTESPRAYHRVNILNTSNANNRNDHIHSIIGGNQGVKGPREARAWDFYVSSSLRLLRIQLIADSSGLCMLGTVGHKRRMPKPIGVSIKLQQRQ
jgi:hypothetical protein